jgi:gluconolactonase
MRETSRMDRGEAPVCSRAMADIEVYDPRFAPVVAHAPVLERLCTGARWSEGPVWMYEDDSVLWSDIHNDRMLRWSARDGMSVWRAPAGFTNGHTRDLDGTLLHCSHGRRAVIRTREDGTDEVVVDRYRGRRLNSPNDIVVRADGTLWFTDPPYGILLPEEGYPAPAELDGCYVFRFDPRSGALDIVADQPGHPNGIAFSPDESRLYVSDTSAALDPNGNHCLWVFDVLDTGLSRGSVFAVVEPGLPDGFRFDPRGLLFTSSRDSVQVYAEDGTRIGRIGVPEKVGNLTFGGPNRDCLYICASTSLYRIRLRTRGVQLP